MTKLFERTHNMQLPLALLIHVGPSEVDFHNEYKLSMKFNPQPIPPFTPSFQRKNSTT